MTPSEHTTTKTRRALDAYEHEQRLLDRLGRDERPNISLLARQHVIDESTLRRALRRAGVAPHERTGRPRVAKP